MDSELEDVITLAVQNGVVIAGLIIGAVLFAALLGGFLQTAMRVQDRGVSFAFRLIGLAALIAALFPICSALVRTVAERAFQ